MRIGIDYRAVTAAPLSGISRQILALEQALKQRSTTDVRLYSAAPLDHPHRQTASCPAVPSPVNGLHRPLQRLRFESRFLPRAITRDGLDLFIATINMGLPIGRVPSSTRLVLILHDTFQITLRNRHASKSREWFYRLTDRLAIGHSVRIADRIWVPSQYTADSVAAIFPRAGSRVRVLPNAVYSAPWTSSSTSLPAGLPGRYWLLVGSHEPRKNIPWFVRQWHAAGGLAALPALVIVGNATNLPAELGALAGVHFVEALTDAEMAAVYRKALRLWHPSYAEGFGLPVIEAAATGTPVATARGSALDEITPPGAPRFSAHDDGALRALMHRYATGGTDARQESRAALETWASQYDKPAYSARLDHLLEELA